MTEKLTIAQLVQRGALVLGDGYRTKKSEHGRPGIPILRVAEVHNGYIRPEFTDYVSNAYRGAMGGKVSRAGDIVLTTKGTVGRVAMIPDDAPEFVYSPQVCYFRVSGGGPLVRRFLYYWFKGPEFWRQARSRKSQTDMADYLNLADVRSLSLTVPDRREQEAVADVLGALDDKIAVNERIAASALGLAEALYIQAAKSSVWRRVKLKDAARWLSGGTPKTSEPLYWGGTIPWISALSLKSPWIERSDRNVTELGAKSGTRLVPAGAVLFVVRGSSLKEEFRIGITQREVAFGQDCKALIAHEGIDPHVLFHGIRSQTMSVLEMVDETSIGAGRLSTDLISNLEIRVPGEPSDPTVARVRSLDHLAATRQQESQTLATLRETLLPQLMSGRLRVKDAEKIVEDNT